MRLIGDIHGKLDLYEKAIAGADETIQVGDFGYGFPNDRNLDYFPKSEKHRFIRGNHDDPAICRQQVGYIESGYAHPRTFYVGGGLSIDRALRLESVSWWPDEEHSWTELEILIEQYAHHKPDFVVSHEAPMQACVDLIPFKGWEYGGPSRTSIALTKMFKIHQPIEWVFGHWHVTRSEIIGRTRFQCLGEGDWIDV